MYENTFPNKRFKKTLQFLQQHVSTEEKILDLGVPNPLSKIMLEQGYKVTNTTGEDLDKHYSSVHNSDAQVVTAFEIFEHLLAPLNILSEIKAEKRPILRTFTPRYYIVYATRKVREY